MMNTAGVSVGLEAILKAFENPTDDFDRGYVSGLQTALNLIQVCEKASVTDDSDSK